MTQQPSQRKTFTFTPAQQLLLAGLYSLLIGAGGAMVSAVGLSYTSVGLDFPVLINIGLVAFGAAFFSALKNYVPAHIKDIMQATEDAYTQVLGTHQATIATLNNVIATLTAQAPVQASQSVPGAYVPKVVQTPIDIPSMPTQSVPVVTATSTTAMQSSTVDLMANVPQNTLQDVMTGTVTSQFMTAGVSRSVPGA